MINIQHRTIFPTIVIFTALGLSSCSSLTGDLFNTDAVQADYQNNKSIKQLEVPPDLTQPEFDKAFELPKGVISAASLKNGGSGVLPSENTNGARQGDLSSIRTVANRSVLQINDTYPRALIMTEIMLGRMSFAAVSKSPAGDVITAKYNGADVNLDGSTSTGLSSRIKNIFNRSAANANQVLVSGKDYLVNISSAQGAPIVTFKRADGSEISEQAHAEIISRLNTAFNR